MNAWRFTCMLLTLLTASVVSAQTPTPADINSQIERVTKKLATQEYTLRYKFEAGETIRWTVTHKAHTETKITGTTQTADSKTISTKVWTVKDVTDGVATFENSVEKINMWSHLSGRPEVRYDSTQDADPPTEYAQAAKTIGIPLSTTKVTMAGRIKNQERALKNPDMGLGQIIFPFPDTHVKLGHSWVVPNEVPVNLGEGRIKRIKIRQRYTLQKVENDVATIALKTEVVTPVNDPRIESQLVQKLTKGSIKFDLELGRIRSKQVEWDETIVGFSGPESSMQYLAKFTEELVTGRKTVASKPKNEPTPAEPIGPKLR